MNISTTFIKYSLALLVGFSLSYGQINSNGSSSNYQTIESNIQLLDKTHPTQPKSFEVANEIVSLRTLNAKHFKNSDGTFTAVINAGPLHYQENGQFKTIEQNLTELNDASATMEYGETEDYLVTIENNISEDCESTTTWTGSNWSDGDPTPLKKVIFAANYNPMASPDLYACSIDVQDSAQVTIGDGLNFIVKNEVNVAPGAKLTVKDGANLIQINDDAVNLGNITVEKEFIFSTDRNQYNFVISPVKNQNIKELFENNNYKAQWYNETTNYFVFFDGDYNEIANIGGAGIGQAIQENQLGASEQVAIYKGVPHNGEYTVEGLGNENTRFHLAGNPYPSQLDLVQFYTDNEDNIESTFLFWDNRGNTQITQQGDDYQGSNYAIFNASSPDGTGTGTAAPAYDSISEYAGKIPTRNVAVGNAFMLRLQTGKNSYEFNNVQRVGGQGENFLGNAPTTNIQNRNTQSTEGNPSSIVDRYWLTLKTPNGATIMNAVVYFDGGNDDFAKDDSKITGGSDDIYTLVDEHQLKIQGKSSFDVNDKIKLGYKAYAAGIHTISIYDKEGVFADGQKIFIRDFQTGIVHELTQSDFTFKTFAGEFNDRFEIFYKRSIKASENKATLSNVVIYQNENHIQIAAENQLLSDVEIYDLNGVSVYQATDINLENWKVPNHLFGKGILVVVVKTADGEVVNKKLINK